MTGGDRGGIYFPLGADSPVQRRPLSGSRRRPSAASTRPASPAALRGMPGVGKSHRRPVARPRHRDASAICLLHLPFRHEPPARLAPIAGLSARARRRPCGGGWSCAVRRTGRRGLKVLEALVSDDSGSVVALWYNQSYLAGRSPTGPRCC